MSFLAVRCRAWKLASDGAFRGESARASPGVLGLVVLLAGCGTLGSDQSKNETNIRHALTKLGVQVRSVKCPKDVKVAKGVVTCCTATLQERRNAVAKSGADR
jgi:hypothetical protein